ncbi:PBP1A family penicillin-binding protein, partial [Candidatus Dependentiae bacterium]|nr:PBP1A family penicillin-binding protein [Candidatus Dependentiae bacterium]
MSAENIKDSISKAKNIVFYGTSALILLTILIFGFVYGIVTELKNGMPDLEQLDRSSKNYTERYVLPSRVYDVNNEVIAEFWEEKRILITMDDISDTLVKAFLAIEDRDFYKHHGLNFKRIVKAIFTNVLKSERAQGASTITQQLARSLFFTRKKIMMRKVAEMLLAIEIERRFTKSEILEGYFNKIFLGSGAYGVEAAARAYFGKHSNQLSLGECAMLAALPKAPSSYSPLKNPDKAKKRQELVLASMVEAGFITEEQKQKSMIEFWSKFRATDHSQINLQFRSKFKVAAHFGEYIYKLLIKDVNLTRQQVYQGGYQIYTTLNVSYQKAAEKVLSAKINEYRKNLKKPRNTPSEFKNEIVQGALLTIDPKTGDILAMCGGSEWTLDNQVNRVTMTPGRQPGSSFKPFIYAAAINAKKITASTVLVDEPVTFHRKGMQPWSPQNYEDEHLGEITIHMALVKSLNVIAAKIMDLVGPGEVVNFVRRFGIEAPLKPYLALALGGQEIPMIELVNAYGAFSNAGLFYKHRAIKYVKDRNDQIIYEKSSSIPFQAMPPEVAYIMSNIMADVTRPGGTATVIGEVMPERRVAGKTGTTNDYKDAWFIGHVPGYVTGVWVGYDRGSIPLGTHQTGGRLSASIWAEYMKIILEGKPIEWYTDVPSNVIFVNVCRESGKLSNEACPI